MSLILKHLPKPQGTGSHLWKCDRATAKSNGLT